MMLVVLLFVIFGEHNQLIINKYCFFLIIFQDNFSGYDPQSYVQNAPVLRTLNLAPPSERRAFRDAERRRLNNIP